MQGPGQSAQPVVIVGGGFAGLYTALALSERRDHPPLLLIEPRDRFVFLPLLYELLSGEMRRWEVAPRYDELLAGRGVAWLQDRVDRIDAERSRVHTRGGRSLAYSRLVLAGGALGDTFGTPGAEQHGYAFRTLADVERLQGLIGQLRSSGRPLQRLAVVGAGASGVELACKLADLLREHAVVELIEQGEDLLPQARAFSRQEARRALERRDVRLRTRTRVLAVEADHLRLRGPALEGAAAPETRLPVNAAIWTAGLSFRPPALTPEPDRDRLGRLHCESDLRLRGQRHIFVAGDLAHVPDRQQEAGEGAPPLPATAQVAFQQATLLATNLMRSLADEPLQPFQWKDLGEMMSLGLGDACLTAAGLTLAGPAAARIRRLAYLSRMPGLPHQLRVAVGWLAEGAT